MFGVIGVERGEGVRYKVNIHEYDEVEVIFDE